MPVPTPHPDYNDCVEVWEQMRDVIAGARAIKNQGSKYLPRLSKQDDQDYDSYKMRADFFDGTSRASDALMGFLFRKPPKVNLVKVPPPPPVVLPPPPPPTPPPAPTPPPKPGAPVPPPPLHEFQQQPPAPQPTPPPPAAPKVPTALDEFKRDATTTGKSLYDLIKDCSRRVVELGRCGVWMDWSDDEDRPFAILYEPQDILNWQFSRIGGRMVLTRLVLIEYDPEFIDLGTGEKEPDKYQQTLYKQWREFELLDDGTGTYYLRVTVWRKKKSQEGIPDMPKPFGTKVIGALIGTGPSYGSSQTSEEFVAVETYNPTRGGKPLDQILFTFFGTDGPYAEISKPPLLGMSDMNLSHYRTSADLENARHFVGVPTPYVFGLGDGAPLNLTLGSSRVWTSSQADTHCGFLEVSGKFDTLTEALADKKNSMAELGVQMISDQGSGADGAKQPEAYATVALRTSAQSSGLTAISRALSQCLTDVLTMAAWWTNDAENPQDLQEDINIEMNLDFMGQPMLAQDASTFMTMMIQGGISYQTFFRLLQEGELIEDGLTMEEEQQRIKAGKSQLFAPVLPGGAQPAAAQPFSKAPPPPPPDQSNV